MGLPAVCHLTRLRLAAPALIGIMLLAACGPNPTLTLQLGDATIQVIAGGTGSTEATISRGGGATADVTLDATGAPDWATVSFAPATLGGGSTQSIMTISTDGEDPAIEATSFTLTVTAVGGGLAASEEVTVQVDLMVVTGTFVDLFHRPVPGASISIDGGAPVPVNADGTFEVPDVVIPYDLVVLNETNGWAHLYQGLASPDPAPMTTALVGPTSSSNVSGDLSAPVGANQLGIVCIEGIDKVVLGACDTIGVGETAYSVTAIWFEGTTASTRVRAWIVAVGAGGAATGYPFQGQTALNLTNAVAAPADVALEEGPGSVEIDFDITPPPGIPLGNAMVFYQYAANASVAFPVGTTSDAFTAVLPDYPGASVTVLAVATNTAGLVYAWETAALTEGFVDLTMPEPVSPVVPASAATNVNLATPFRVDNPSGAPPTFLFSGPTTFFVTTSGNETRLPDLSALGMALPAAANYSWQVVVSSHLGSVDTVAHEGWYPIGDLQQMVTGGPALPAGSIQVASPRSFTTE